VSPKSILLALALAGCATASTPPLPPPPDPAVFAPVTPSPRPATELAIRAAADAPAVIFMGGLDLTGERVRSVRGLSDVKVADRRTHALVAVTDLGWWVRMTPRLDADRRLVGLDAVSVAAIADTRGRALIERPRDWKNFNRWADAESLALLDGRPVVGFEHEQRIWRYAHPGARATRAPVPEPLPFDDNSGFEAMTADGQGGWWVAVESGGVWRCRTGRGCRKATALPMKVPDDPELRVVSMDLDPQGKGILVLQRGWSREEGTLVRVSRWRPVEDPLKPMRLETLFDLPRAQAVANFEGLAAVRTGPGGGWTRLYLVADDNNDDRQPGQIVAFDLR
jgi:hypothetical protein